jgi:hypothetical protein
LEDSLKSHPFYFRAAKLAIDIYLQLHDNPLAEDVDSSATANGQPTLHPIENGHTKKSKKERKQAKAEANKVEQTKSTTAQKGKEENFSSTLHTEPLVPKDLEHPKNALAEAERFLKPLQLLSSQRIDTHLLSFELYLRKQKSLLMLKSLKRSAQLQPNHPQLKQQLQTFAEYVRNASDQLNVHVKQVIDNDLPKLQAAVASGDLGYGAASLETSFAKLNV